MATISAMKDELHARLWAAQERWFALKECGATKHELKLQGLRERGDMFYCTRGLLFTGATRIAYERELKHFLDYCHEQRGRTENSQIDKRDFRAYIVGGGEKTGQFRRPETGHRRVKGGVERPPTGTLGMEVPRTSAAMI